MPRSRAWVGAVLAGLLLAVYVGTAAATPSVDAASASLQGWRIATSGEPWLEDVDVEVLPYSYDDPPYWISRSAHEHDVVFRSPGVTATSVLAYLASDDAPNSFAIRPASTVAALLTWTAVLLMYGALRTRLRARTSLAACAVLGLGTPVWSVAADAMWPHTLTVLGISGMAFAASRERWLLAGVLGGVGLSGRLHLALVVAILGAVVGSLRRRPGPTVLVGAGSVPFLGLCALWSRWLYGQWDPAGGYPQADAYAQRATSESILDTLVNEAGLWISLDRGFLIWTPIALVLLPALIRSWSALPDWARALVLGGLAYTLVQGLMNHFAGGSAFYGYRLTLELLLCLTPALALSVPQLGAWGRRVVPPLAGLQVGAIAFGAVFDSIGLPLEDAWTDNAFLHAMREVPALLVPWLLCGLLGVLLARMVSRTGSAVDKAHQRG